MSATRAFLGLVPVDYSQCLDHPEANVEVIEDSRGWTAFQCQHGCWLGSIGKGLE